MITVPRATGNEHLSFYLNLYHAKIFLLIFVLIYALFYFIYILKCMTTWVKTSKIIVGHMNPFPPCFPFPQIETNTQIKKTSSNIFPFLPASVHQINYEMNEKSAAVHLHLDKVLLTTRGGPVDKLLTGGSIREGRAGGGARWKREDTVNHQGWGEHTHINIDMMTEQHRISHWFTHVVQPASKRRALRRNRL